MTEQLAEQIRQERLYCVGLVLAEVGRLRLAGEHGEAARLDALALAMEHGQESPRLKRFKERLATR